MNIPRKLKLADNLVIFIRQVTPVKLRTIIDEPDNNASTLAFWLADENTIYIDKTLPPWSKRLLYLHELQHAVNDLALQALNINLRQENP